MNKHTPGPWKWSVESVDPEWAIVTAAGGNIVANVNSETGPDIPPLVSTKMPQMANAALIAAAPELLEALERIAEEDVIECGDGDGPCCAVCGGLQKIRGLDFYVDHYDDCAIVAARAAIAKARGEA